MQEKRADALFNRSFVTATIVAISGMASTVGGLGRDRPRLMVFTQSKTASGERCDPNALTAAHRSLPFGTKVKVENLKNGRSVVVASTTAARSSAGRIIDLTKAAAGKLGFIRAGTAKVRLTVLARG